MPRHPARTGSGFEPGDRVVAVFLIVTVAEKGERGVVTDDDHLPVPKSMVPVPVLRSMVPVRFDGRDKIDWVFRIAIRHLGPVERLAELA